MKHKRLAELEHQKIRDKKYKEMRTKSEYKEIIKCTDDINDILKKYGYKVDISEWLVFTNKRGSFSFETDEMGLFRVEP
jgi:N-acetyl-anhydromuramyl-L-alanine amidase AmpD